MGETIDLFSVQYAASFENSNRFTRQEYTEPTMARYGLTTEESAPKSPVIFDHEFFDHRMRVYQNSFSTLDGQLQRPIVRYSILMHLTLSLSISGIGQSMQVTTLESLQREQK